MRTGSECRLTFNATVRMDLQAKRREREREVKSKLFLRSEESEERGAVSSVVDGFLSTTIVLKLTGKKSIEVCFRYISFNDPRASEQRRGTRQSTTTYISSTLLLIM